MMGLYNSQSASGIQIKNDSTGVNIKDIKRFNGVIGSAVGSLVEYGISGQTTVSLLNFRDIAEAADLTGWRDGNGEYYSVGLMELRLGGKKASLGIGMGGYDLSVGNILAGARGMGDANKVFNYRMGGEEKNADLEIVASGTQIASSQFQANAKKLWEGVLKTSYEDMGMDNYGYYDQKNPNTIAISREFLSGGKENVAKLASIFDHEGTHYTGDRVEANAYRAGLQTYLSMSQLLGVGDRDFAMGMINELGDASNQIANTGERDYWTLRKDGTLVYDKSGWLKNEQNKYINIDGTLSDKPIPGKTIGADGIETGLVNILFGGTSGKAYDPNDPKVRATQSFLIASGFIHRIRRIGIGVGKTGRLMFGRASSALAAKRKLSWNQMFIKAATWGGSSIEQWCPIILAVLLLNQSSSKCIKGRLRL
jgi:hypothetical protein